MENKQNVQENDFSKNIFDFYNHEKDIKEICVDAISESFNIYNTQQKISSILNKDTPLDKVHIAFFKIHYDNFNFDLINFLIFESEYIDKDRFDDKILEIIYQTNLLLVENEAKALELLKL